MACDDFDMYNQPVWIKITWRTADEGNPFSGVFLSCTYIFYIRKKLRYVLKYNLLWNCSYYSQIICHLCSPIKGKMNVSAGVGFVHMAYVGTPSHCDVIGEMSNECVN